MPREARAAPAGALKSSPIFFGDWPESAGFVLLTARPAAPPASLPSVRALIECLVQAVRAQEGASWWLALGRRLLPESGPRHLRPLALHGDGATIPDLTDHLYAALFLSGPAGLVPDLLAELAGRVPAPEGVEIGLHLGSISPKGIGNGGFVDPVSNLQELEPAQFDDCLFVGEEDARFRGWSYLVLRDYHEDIEMWHDLPCTVQEQIIGRDKAGGHLLGGSLLWRRGGGTEVAERAHVACVRPGRDGRRFQWRDRLYRRSLNYVEGDGRQLRHGLYFIGLCRNPVAQFKRIHDRYVFRDGGRFDRLISSGYVSPKSSALMMLPPVCDLAALGLPC